MASTEQMATFQQAMAQFLEDLRRDNGTAPMIINQGVVPAMMPAEALPADSEASESSPAQKFCLKCKRHGQKLVIKGHKNICQYKTCTCSTCRDVDKQNQLKYASKRRTAQKNATPKALQVDASSQIQLNKLSAITPGTIVHELCTVIHSISAPRPCQYGNMTMFLIVDSEGTLITCKAFDLQHALVPGQAYAFSTNMKVQEMFEVHRPYNLGSTFTEIVMSQGAHVVALNANLSSIWSKFSMQVAADCPPGGRMALVVGFVRKITKIENDKGLCLELIDESQWMMVLKLWGVHENPCAVGDLVKIDWVQKNDRPFQGIFDWRIWMKAIPIGSVQIQVLPTCQYKSRYQWFKKKGGGLHVKNMSSEPALPML